MGNELYTNSVFVDTATLTHTKLNTLDANIDNGFTMVSGALAAVAGDDRVLDDKDISTELSVTPSGPADMNINIAVGYANVSEMIVRNESAAVLTLVAPTVSNRYDICQISNVGVLSTKSSAEQASPVEPSADANNLKLAAIYLPQNTAQIDASDIGNGYIIDRRVYSLHPITVKRKVTFNIPGTLDTSGGPASNGYFIGSTGAGTGLTFGQAVNVESGFIQVQDGPTGANLVFTIHNLDETTSDTISLTDGLTDLEDSSISLAFGASDNLAIQCTTVGSTLPGGWATIILGYVLT